MENENNTEYALLVDAYDQNAQLSTGTQKLKKQWTQIFILVVVLEAVNTLLFLGGPAILARVNQPKQAQYDACKSQS